MSKWNHEKFGNIDRRIDDLRLQMASQSKKDDNAYYIEMAHDLFVDLLKPESLWKQKSHERHANLGDKNTKYFCQKMRRNKQRIRILAIEDMNGRLTKDSKTIAGQTMTINGMKQQDLVLFVQANYL